MKNLILIRHGKSSWDIPVQDHDRPLINRGVLDAHLTSDKLKQFLPSRFILWTSTAKRAFDTALIFSQNYLISEELLLTDYKLYTFDYISLHNFIKMVNNDHDNLIIFGHNNAITDFVNKFGDTYIEKVPTSGVVILKFNQENWNDIQNGKTVKTIFPKDLKNDTETS